MSEPGMFEVSSERMEGKFYVVDLNKKSCECADHKYRGSFCKHLRLVTGKADIQQPVPEEKPLPEVLPAIERDLPRYGNDNIGQTLRANLETREARLAEILEPLLAVTPPERTDVFKTIVSREETLRKERVQETYEFRILEALIETVEDHKPKEKTIEMPTKDVVDAYNRHYANKQTTARSVGRVLLRFGFQKVRLDKTEKQERKRGWRVDLAKLAELVVSTA